MATNGKDQALLAAYLVVGEDDLKREAVMRRLRARFEQMGELSFNSDVFNGQTASGADIVSACNTVPFASPMRLVEVRDADALGKADSEVLVSYLAAPNETTVLALSCQKLAKNTRLYKAVAKLGKSAVIDCTPPKRKDLPQMARSMATGYGIVLTPGAAERLVDLVGEDTVRLDAEVKKLSLSHQGKDPVGEREVDEFVGRTSEAKTWELLDAMSSRDLSLCMDCLGRMSSASPHALLPSCVRRLRELACARAMIARGTPQDTASELGIPDWQARKRLSWARNFSDEELRRAIVTSRDAECAMKGGADPQAVFEEWLVSVAARPQSGRGARFRG